MHSTYLQRAIMLPLPWKQRRWHSTRIELFKCNQSTIKCRCFLSKIIHNEVMQTCFFSFRGPVFLDIVYYHYHCYCYYYYYYYYYHYYCCYFTNRTEKRAASSTLFTIQHPMTVVGINCRSPSGLIRTWWLHRTWQSCSVPTYCGQRTRRRWLWLALYSLAPFC